MPRIFYAQFLVLVVVAILFLFFGAYLRFSETIWWWDIPLHILGGLWVALALSWLARTAGFSTNFARCLAFAFVVGVLWEAFEAELGIGGSAFMPYWVDTIKDVFDDCIGGTIAGLIVNRFL